MFLSGGLDSSAVAALMAREIDRPVQTFSVAFAEPDCSELAHARAVADAIGADAHEVVVDAADFFRALPRLVWHEDEPLAHPSSVPLHFVSALARQHVKVVLTGEGSDELLAGYGKYWRALANWRAGRAYTRLVPEVVRSAVASGVVPYLPGRVGRLARRSFLAVPPRPAEMFLDTFAAMPVAQQQRLLRSSVCAGAAPYAPSLDYFARVNGRSTLLDRLLYMDVKTYLVELLMKQDQMSMSTGRASAASSIPPPSGISWCASRRARQRRRRDLGAPQLRAVAAHVEPGLAELLQQGVEARRLRATDDAAAAVRDTDVSLVCVGTPSHRNGSLDLTFLTRVCEQIGAALRAKTSYHVVVIRSTILPGTTHGRLIPALEAASGARYGEGFGVCVNPEFLREGTALADFRQPPLTLVGHNHAADAAPAAALYQHLPAPLCHTSIRVAEMLKYACNAWHAVKIVFANEIGNLCKRMEIDAHEVMDIFCADAKLNLSPYYLRPGFAFGGSCLPKDIRALQYRGKETDLELPLINALLGSNRLQVQHAIDRIVETGRKRVGLLGFSFKAGTDDLREAPMVILAEALLGKGYGLAIYDRNVSLARLVGANKQYIEEQIPHLSRHLCDSTDDLLDRSDVIVVGNADPEFAGVVARARPDQVVIDLVRLPLDFSRVRAQYDGICW